MNKKVKELVNQLNHYRDAYYNHNTSIISDEEYDKLFDELESLEKTTGIIYANSPTQSVGYEVVSKLNKVTHNHPLLSLAKTTDIQEFADYFGNKSTVIMAKLDGLTCSILYKNGKLIRAESRGNGEVGEDITHNIITLQNVPKAIPFLGQLIVDGECIIDYETFEYIKQNENIEYKNPRNLASGTVRQLNSEVCAKRNVKFIAWKLYRADTEKPIKTFKESFDFLESLGFDVVPYVIPSGVSIDRCIRAVENDIAELQYPIDGIVGAFNDIEYGESLGMTGHHPKHSFAFKFYQERNETTLLDIEWSTSRTGAVNPVAIFEPVEIDGTIVSRATLSNVSIIKKLELGIGDTINVIKSNQIIPMITDNLTRSGTYQIPTVCPCCGSELKIKNDTGRETLYCTNHDCMAIKHDKILNYISRNGMNIAGISDERLRILMAKGYIIDFKSIYDLHKYRSRLKNIDGFGDASVENLIKSIEESKHCKFVNVLVAIGIPNIGKSSAKILSGYCMANKNEENILQWFIDKASNGYDWSVLADIGSLTSDNINSFVKSNYDDIKSLVDILDIVENNMEENNCSNIFSGKTFCITGKLYHFKNRDELVSTIEENGGKVVSGVTSKTDYLITNDKTSGSSKNKKAEKFGTKIIDENEFILKINI